MITLYKTMWAVGGVLAALILSQIVLIVVYTLLKGLN